MKLFEKIQVEFDLTFVYTITPMVTSIISLKELFHKFIQNAGFHHVYREPSFLVDVQGEVVSEVDGILESLCVSSLIGKRSILFCNSNVELEKMRLLNGIFVIISFVIPERITIPTIFCKSANELKDALEVSLEFSDEARLPVMIVIAKQLSGILMEGTDFSFGSQKTYSNLNKDMFETISSSAILEKFSVAEILLCSKLPQRIISGRLSLNDCGVFFKYLVPFSDVNNRIDLENTFVDEREFDSLKGILKQDDLLLSVRKGQEKSSGENCFRKNLCPGCPFVSIFKNGGYKDCEIFTDIECSSVLELFGMTKLSSNEAYGMFISDINKRYLFIGRYSRFREKFVGKIPKGSVIILKDINRERDFLKAINHPEKALTPNYIFPYACENIIKYKPVRFNLAKCNCFQKGTQPLCVENTFCPALEIGVGKVFLNRDLCTGCNACVKFCPTGALK